MTIISRRNIDTFLPLIYPKCREEITSVLNLYFGNRWCTPEDVENSAFKESKTIVTIVDKRMKLYSQNTYHLYPLNL